MNIREELSPQENLFELVKTGNGGTLSFNQNQVTYSQPVSIDPSTNNGFNTLFSFTGKAGSGVNGDYSFRYGRLATFVAEDNYEVGYNAGQGLPELLLSLHRDYNVYMGEITLVDTSQVTFGTSDRTRQPFTFRIADTSLMYSPGTYSGLAYFKGSLYGAEVFSYISFAGSTTNSTEDEVPQRTWIAIDGTIESVVGEPNRMFFLSDDGPTARLETTQVSDFPTTGDVTIDMLVKPMFAANDQCLFSFIENGTTLMTGLFTNQAGQFSLIAEGQEVFSGVSPSGWLNDTEALVSIQKGASGWSFWLNGFHLITVASEWIFARPQNQGSGSTFQFGNSVGFQDISLFGSILKTMIRSQAAYVPEQSFDPVTEGPFPSSEAVEDLSTLYPNTTLGTFQSAMFS